MRTIYVKNEPIAHVTDEWRAGFRLVRIKAVHANVFDDHWLPPAIVDMLVEGAKFTPGAVVLEDPPA